MPEKTLPQKFGAAAYYMLASMIVQFVNKVGSQCDCKIPHPPPFTPRRPTSRARTPNQTARNVLAIGSAVRTIVALAQRRLLAQALFTSQSFNFPLLVAFLQMSVICPVCYAVARPRVTVELAKLVSPLALVNVLNVVCGLISAPHHPTPSRALRLPVFQPN